MNRLNRFVAAGLTGLLLVTGAWAQGQAPDRRAPFPQLALPDTKASGQRAVDLLGDRLPEVAAWYRKSPDELRSLLLNDRMLKIDRRGRLFFEDEFIAPQPSTPAQTESAVLDGTLAPLDQTFLLHSKPGAKRTIYLNFRGATLNNTAWGSGITALPFDTDGVPYVQTDAELQRIQYMWQRVAEDYAPFDVNVTTAPPSSDLITRSGSGDEVFGTTVVITSNVGVYNCNCGGVAYVGIFDDTSDYYKPALVFWNKLGGGNEKYVAEAISHEAGHNMGLNHDGTKSVGYYEGHGSGTTGWAPIMGVGYYQNLVQWSKGQYAGANNVQDDYLVMGSNGLPLRADDHGDTTGTATPMADTSGGGTISFAATGVIERPADVDMFSFSAGAGLATITLSPAARSANLDALIEVRNSAGVVIASANPPDALNANFTITLPATGAYYVSVQGVGKGDPLTTGYTDYGSLGLYALAVTATTGSSGSPPVAVITATPTTSGTVPLVVNFSSAGSSDPDGTIVTTSWTFGDGGSATSAAPSHTYNAAGTYTATLQVTDKSGLTGLSSVTISAQPQVGIVPMRVDSITMGLLPVQKNGMARATAAVAVKDGNGNVVPGATVTGTWSGIVTGNASGLSGGDGTASFTSPQTRTAGTFTFTVTGVTLSGYSYNPVGSVTNKSISR